MAEMRLTVQQQQVVENRGGTLLVSAAAGSGKTKVLVDRVIRKILEDGKNINEFLMITFTNAAAAELRVKISAALTKELARQPGNRHIARQLNLLPLSQISTVHAFCGTLIRQYGYLLNVSPDYRMLEDQERTELLDQILEDLLEEAYEACEPGFQLLTDTLGAGRNDSALTDLIKTLYEKLQSQPDPQGWLHQRQISIPLEQELRETVWGNILVASAGQRLTWILSRYDWAIDAMVGDEKLEKQYLPCFQTQRRALQAMLEALDGPWDALGETFQLENPTVRVTKYPDQLKLDAIKAVKSDAVSLVQDLGQLFSRSSQALKEEQNAMAPALTALAALLEQLDRRFSAEKRRKNLLDFSDQEHLAIRLLIRPGSGKPTDAACEIGARFTEIMVDEYQDSNRIQELIFTAIASGADENRFLVGDVKQSIYGFRQAEPSIFLKKYQDFLPAEQAAPGQARKLVLSKNFRSRPEILEAVNHVFATVMSQEVGDIVYGPDERLYPGLEAYPETGKTHVELHVLELQRAEEESSKYQREADWVVQRIIQLLQERIPVRDGGGLRPVHPSDIAVLFRTRDPIGRYRRALQKAGIPAASDSGDSLFDTPEVKVLLNLLRTLNNPHQDIPLLAVLCSPVFRWSNGQIAQVRAESAQPRFYDAMRESREPWCIRTLEQLEVLRQMASRQSADGLVWTLLHDLGLLSAYSAMEGGTARRDNLLAVYQLACDSAGGEYLYLYQLLRKLERAAEGGTATAAKASDGVVLTTMHKSKGLEYPVVILADLSRKFNFRELQDTVLFDGDLGIAAKITDQTLRIRYPGLCYEALQLKKRQILRSEELRILYVAMTRAKDYLMMTYAGEHTGSALAKLRAGVGAPAAPWAAANVGCLGDWVLLAAMNRIEAGDLFEQAGRPDCRLTVSDYPWNICYTQVEPTEAPMELWQDAPSAQEHLRIPSPAQLASVLQWADPHREATLAPSKLTATQLKGRDKDTEAAEGAKAQVRIPSLRRPQVVMEHRGLSPTERGTAMHLFLQYAEFSNCLTAEGVESEKLRLEDEEFLTAQQLEAVQPEPLVQLFSSPLGQRMLRADQLIREFKFSMLEDAQTYYAGTEGEQVLLQGVIDAAFWEEDGLCVVDFKTDSVTEQSMAARAEEYRGQLETYRRALVRIFNKPVKEMILYFLSAGKEWKL